MRKESLSFNNEVQVRACVTFSAEVSLSGTLTSSRARLAVVLQIMEPLNKHNKRTGTCSAAH